MNDILTMTKSDPVFIFLDPDSMENRKSGKNVYVSCPLCLKTRIVSYLNLEKIRSTYCKSCSMVRDLRGMRFDKLYVLKYLVDDKKWLCVCDCGEVTKVSTNQLIFKTKSCGCLKIGETHSRYIDMTGERYGRLVVKEYLGGKYQYRRCVCDCGKEIIVSGNALRTGQESCGCKRTEDLIERLTGETNPRYNPNLTDEEREAKREDDERYLIWRRGVRKKYGYNCAVCGSGHKTVAHHLFNYSDYLEMRYKKDNGIVLCHECHYDFHVRFMGGYHVSCTKQDYLDWCKYKQKEAV
jgi:5-methylcytosine-specific restriction endonuclease McrA